MTITALVVVGYGVGGAVTATTIGRHGVATEVARAWDDVLGRPIEPLSS